MSLIQQMENEEFERGCYPSDRFAGFDRGDAGAPDDEPYFRVVLDEILPSGDHLSAGVWAGGVADGFGEVRINGKMVAGGFDGFGEGRALEVAAWWRGGCQS
jgi:hypothetical protein